ncbi:aryl-sulfate sulfotransferase [Halomicrobium katesii]|uniref:aryl-sulfate sulfotransferase n=1 Tax=Halomicrobium katesii TaxID=437163 RepID=UPI000382696D|nr:aryl-sulfate sulfotransferase [Halomicrobium katesii]
MRARTRSALRVLFLTVMILSAAAVAQSFLQSTAGAETGTETTTATPAATPPDDATTVAEENRSAGGDATATAAPPSSGLTEVDVESRFQRAKSETLPGENWSTQRVRAASGDRGLTVVATQGFYVSGQTAELAALTPDGSVVYFNDTYRVYFDVDPVEGERYTVEYVAAKRFEGEDCEQFHSKQCTRNVVNRVNLTTGDHETVYAEMTPQVASGRWHDVDRINDTHLIVADIVEDSVFVVDTRDDSVVWEWRFDEHYSREAGGQGGDWTHVNDVEVLSDGRIMLSPRNMDEVIFLDRTDGGGYAVDENWTLGEDDDHSILYEQHNADYIPRAYGGPAVVVADSENARAVEYQRVDGEWVQSWSWRDVRLKWPRDADRLPNGNTLLVDSNGNRLVEVNADDEIVWSAAVGMPYDVERIGTGDESEGGPAARLRGRAPVEPRTQPEDGTNETATEVAIGDGTASDRTVTDQFWLALKDVTPSLVTNGILYTAPPWVLFTDLAFAALFVLVGLCWASSEFYWAGHTLRGVAAGIGRRVRTGVENVR